MDTGARYWQRQQRLGALLSALLSLSVSAGASAQPCAPEPAAASPATNTLSNTLGGHSNKAVRLTTALSQQPCRRTALEPAIDVHHLSPAAASIVTARETRMEMDPRIDLESRLRAELGESGTAVARQFDVQWKNTPGPAWVGTVPDWVTNTARNYRHRGVPLVDLWQSSHYMVALGLSNHGIPGVYFTQKLP
jgi:hypothetical protein